MSNPAAATSLGAFSGSRAAPTAFSTGLTPAEEEQLSLLAEECAQVIQMVMKIKRHGWESVNPTLPPAERETNRAALVRELGHVDAAMRILHLHGQMNVTDIMAASREMLDALPQWLHFTRV